MLDSVAYPLRVWALECVVVGHSPTQIAFDMRNKLAASLNYPGTSQGFSCNKPILVVKRVKFWTRLLVCKY